MAYGKIHETFWDDPILRELARVNEDTRTFMAYLITCRHKNRLGCYVLDFRYAAADLGWSEERVEAASLQLEQKGRIQYDREQRVVLVVRFLKHNTMENINVVRGAIASLNGVPSTPLLPELLSRVEKYHVAHYQPLITALRNRLGNDYPNGMPNPRLKESKATATATTTTLATATTIPKEDDAAAQPRSVEDFVSETIRVANRGMADNASIGDRCRPITTSHGSRQSVFDWLSAGVSQETIQRAVYSAAVSYKPDATHRQISTMKYFDGAVKDAHDATPRGPNGNGTSDGHGGRTAGKGAEQKGGEFDHLA